MNDSGLIWGRGLCSYRFFISFSKPWFDSMRKFICHSCFYIFILSFSCGIITQVVKPLHKKTVRLGCMACHSVGIPTNKELIWFKKFFLATQAGTIFHFSSLTPERQLTNIQPTLLPMYRTPVLCKAGFYITITTLSSTPQKQKR